MDIPPKGTILRDHYELGVRWRQMGRALAKDVPLLGAVGLSLAGTPLVRDLYPSPKTIARSDAFTGRNHPTIAYRVWTVLSYGMLALGVLALLTVFLGWV